MEDRSGGKTSAAGKLRRAAAAAKRVGHLFIGRWFFAAAVVAIGFHIATAGLDWSVNFHPDEHKIAKWVAEVHDEGYITGRGYPGGWFELNRVRIWIQKRIDGIGRAWHSHAVQDGKVVAVTEDSFRYKSAPSFKSVFEKIQAGRDFNAALYVLAALLVYLAALESGMSPPAAFVSAGFFFAYAAPIEFAHYCESDGGLIFTLALSAWLFARAIRKASPLWTVLAAFSSGFAISTKPVLFPLVLPVLAAPWVVCLSSPALRGKCRLAIPLLTLVCLAAAAWGFTTGTPAIRENMSWYFESMRETGRRTYAELQRNMGGKATFRFATVLRTRDFAGRIAEIGLFPILWGLLSWRLWFGKDFRRQLAGVPALLPVFPLFVVLCCPFVRRQETLPIGIIMALGMGLPAEILVRRIREGIPLRRREAISAALCAVLGLLALWEGAGKAAGMIQCFQLRDTRAEMQNWLRRTFPRGKPLGFDRYTGQAARGVDCQVAAFGGLPYRWQGLPLAPDKDRPGDSWPADGAPVEYYIENVGFTGRYPIFDRRTGAIRDDVREKMAGYEAAVSDCRVWSAGRHAVRPTFGHPALRMVSFVKPAPDAVDIPIALPRPVFIQPIRTGIYFAEGAPGLGAIAATPAYGRFSPVYFQPEDEPLWLVTRMLEGDAPTKVLRRGTGGKATERLPAGGIVAAPLRTGPAARLFGRFLAYRSACVRVRGAAQSGGCYSYVVSSAEELARELRLGGNPSGALAFLEKDPSLSKTAMVEAFLCATDAGAPPRREWKEAAAEAVAAAGLLAGQGGAFGLGGVTVRGVPLEVVRDFSRARIAVDEDTGPLLPAFLPAGKYHLTLRFPAVERNVAETMAAHALFDGQTPFAVSERGDFIDLEARLDLDKGSHPAFLGLEDFDGEMPPCEMEISWDPVEQALSAAAELKRRLD